MTRTSARIIIFLISTSVLLYAISVATITFKGINITTFHLSEPVSIGYAIAWLIVAPSGLWGIFGSIQDNTSLCVRYSKDHWFSFLLITIVDTLKIIFSFTMKNDSIEKCLDSTDGSEEAIISCQEKIDFNQKAGLVVFGIQEFLLGVLGILIWYSSRYIMQKKMVKPKVVLEQNDLETQSPRELNDVTHELGEQIMPLESIEPLSYRPLQNNEGQNERQNERQNIKQNNTETMPDILRSHEISMGGSNNNVPGQYTHEISMGGSNNNVQGQYTHEISMGGSNNNVQGQYTQYTHENLMGGSNKQHTRSTRRKSLLDEVQTQQLPPQGMNPIGPGRLNNNRLPPPLPEYRQPLQYSQYSQYSQGVQNNRPPHPVSYYNRPPPPQLQQPSNYQPPYPLPQQRQVSNNVQEAYMRGHRRSKSLPQMQVRPLPVPPGLDKSTAQQLPPIPFQSFKQQQAIPPQIIERQQKVPAIIESTSNNKNSRNTSTTARQRQLSTSSQYKPPIHRSGSLPNLNNHEDLMRNEMSFAPPVPSIPPVQSIPLNLQPGVNNNNKLNNKSTQKPKPQPIITQKPKPQPIINNTDKFDRFINVYGNKDYNMVPESPRTNNYSVTQYNNDDDDWNTSEKDLPQRVSKSAQAVRGEPYSSYGMTNGTNNNYVEQMRYNGRNFVQRNPMGYNGNGGGDGGDSSWVNPQPKYYY